jgi:hypothetical protein
MRLHYTFSLVLLSLTSSALGQTHFCIAGDLDHLKASQVTECKTKMTNLREAVKRRGAPSGWHFVVICDEHGWSDYATFLAQGTPPMGEAAFHTDGNQRWTFVRGSRMDADSPEAAEMLLAVALKGVPAPNATPMPNPKRVLREPTLSVASVEPPALP